jgi:folate-binding protein YgfZ
MAAFPYSSILVSGADAFDFLQAQLSNDLRLLEDRPQLLAAWCNPKGRVICIMRVSRGDSGYKLVLPAALAEPVLKRLTMFRFRSNVDFESAPATAEDLGIAGSTEDWLLDKLRAGQPEIWLAQSEEFTPHMLNLDLLGAISFDKGCYPGQEIVARTHYRGATKRRAHRFESAQAVSPGDKVSDGERDVGEVLNVIGLDLLAVIPSDKADDPLTVNGVKLKPIPLENP